MLSKARIKYIQSLSLKKYRKQYNCFIAEGNKTVLELINSQMKIKLICATADWLNENEQEIQTAGAEVIETDANEMKKISALKTPAGVLAVVEIPDYKPDENVIRNSYSIVLDDLQDPGNLGTIIRIADWFGFNNIFCSPDTADVYNPKVVQATMGSIARINIFYQPLPDLFRYYNNIPVYGAVLQGENIYTADFNSHGFIVIGNEGKGISENVLQHIKKGITIPSFGGAESLNAGVAAGIICAIIKGKIS